MSNLASARPHETAVSAMLQQLLKWTTNESTFSQ
jgi:hypothetical protein